MGQGSLMGVWREVVVDGQDSKYTAYRYMKISKNKQKIIKNRFIKDT